MNRADFLGIAISIGLHVALLIAFAFITTVTRPLSVGFVEVELGDFLLGRPVQEVKVEQPEPVPQEEPAEPEPAPSTEPEVKPEQAQPVDLPDQKLPVQEEALPPEEKPEKKKENIPAETPEKNTHEEPSAPPRKEIRPLGSGRLKGSRGVLSGDEGEGEDERKTSPYSLEGLNRTPLFAVLPQYPVKEEAIIQMRITVDPDGNIIRMIPVRKGNPALENAVREALRKWKFNALPPGVPRENQTGIITFRFTLD